MPIPQARTARPSKQIAASTLVVPVFAFAVFLNAALLFTVEPMFTKMVLPLLGGTPAVWNTCLMFFQGMLLIGYLYAHLTTRWMRPRVQGAVHLTLLVASIALLPLGVPSQLSSPAGLALPVGWLVSLLLTSLGLPFLLLAAGAPLLQQWLSTTSHPAARNPYTLYAASNLGSFAALLAYPTLIEPRFRLSEQGIGWMWVFVVLIAVVAGAWMLALRLRWKDDGRAIEASDPAPSQGTFPNGGGTPSAHIEESPETSARSIVPTRAWRLRWVLLAFAPSSLLLGVTNYLSTDVAAFPLLWVVPLALYLLTFVVAFAARPVLSHRVMLFLQVPVGVALIVLIASTPTTMIGSYMLLHLLGFFLASMVCHRALADARPRVEHLTEYYLWMAVGGALGGVFNVLVAPLVYDRVLEYPVALILAFGLRPSTTPVTRASLRWDLILPLVLYGGILAGYELRFPPGRLASVMAYGLLGVAGLAVVSFARRPLRLALGAAALFYAIDARANDDSGVLFRGRSFFGVYKVHRWGEYHALQHGTTTHGGQSTDKERRTDPLTYYYRGGPLGDAFAVLSDTLATRTVALVGLGTGTTACYSRPGEAWTYFEIDPVIVTIARDPRLFTYLRDCGRDVQVKLGDARISLAQARDSSFDLIVLDAFSSDAIPAHLMTREALRMYLRKLKPSGTALFHISNRYLRLEPVLAELARDAHVASAMGTRDVSDEERVKLYYGNRWVAISRDSTRLRQLVDDRGWTPLQRDSTVRLWTDDYSDILGVMKWK